ncbi:MAG: Rieske 2Fe-2S domain-containing protein [Nocardioides sp.]|uniref:Rieske 2Fe-2S domain-containing protein n=1 Tax=Nocardioides sp. TaxID=35761 RepID=UPI0023A28F9A|nr:Rieske 2Fe-2S domain-containing protein [Nocardioides sp.]MDE0776316.1 Rieske 2Fe-2S domain-containing protein [Nocardioides sp.]
MTLARGEHVTSRTTPRTADFSGRVSRRRALSGVAGLGLALPVLSACGESAGPASSESGDVGTPEDSTSASAEPTTAAPSSEPEPDDDGVLASTADIPVGGGVIFTDDRVVVTQPAAGDFKCFSAVCTHTGCLVAGVSTSIVCQCHGSSFDLATGEVLGGPAAAPLPAVEFTIEKDQVVLS